MSEPVEPAPGDPRRTLPRIRGPMLAILGGAGLLGATIACLAVFDVRPVAGTALVWVLGWPVAVLAHASLGALVMGGILDWRTTNPMVRPWVRWLLTVLVAAYVVAVILADRFVLGITATTAQTVAFVVVAVVSVLGGALAAYFAVSPRQLRETSEAVAILFLSALGGLTAGALTVVALVVALAFHRDRTLPDADIAIPAVAGVSGGYVALGDSYSAGEGLEPFDPGTASGSGDGCHRSRHAYSQLLTFAPPVSSSRFMACSGAVSPDVFTGYTQASQHKVLPQAELGPDPGVGLVTLTMSGNDVLFPQLVVHCFEHDSCLDDRFTPPSAQPPSVPQNPDDTDDANRPAASRVAFPPAQALGSWLDEAASLVDDRMDVLYGKLRTAYPQARIVVIGYPYLFPAQKATLRPDDCASILRRFSFEERQAIRERAKRFNTVLYARAVQDGLEFVSPEAVWDGHEPCGSKGQYTNSIKFILTPNIVDGGSFHPNRSGQKALAALVACYLNANPTSPNPYVGGVEHPIDVVGLPLPADIGLVDPPGSFESPVPCGP